MPSTGRRVVATVTLAFILSLSPTGSGEVLLVRDINVGRERPDGAVAVVGRAGEHVLFRAVSAGLGHEPWISDGSPLGTLPLADATPGGNSSSVAPLGQTDTLAFFAAEVSSSGHDVWRTDGTAVGTFALGIQVSLSFGQSPISAVADERLFVLGDTALGTTLWVSDGTQAGTRMVTSFPHVYIPENGMTTVGDAVYFLAGDALGTTRLWRSDGTTEGTLPLTPPAAADTTLGSVRLGDAGLVAAGDRVFWMNPTDLGQSLWTSNGTPDGTAALMEFLAPDSRTPTRFLARQGASVLFVAEDVRYGAELWRSDGTAAGTHPITDFGYYTPFAHNFEPAQLATVGGRILFIASDGLTTPRLWTTDGDPHSAAPLDGCEGGCPSPGPRYDFTPASLVPIDASGVLFVGHDDVEQDELWITDGTGPGTRRVTQCPGLCSNLVEHLRVVDGIGYYFGGSSLPTIGMWRTDGTAHGTRLIGPGLRAFGPYSGPTTGPWTAIQLGDQLLFGAYHDETGIQLWSTDGTAAGTSLVTLIEGEGGHDSSPRDFQPLANGALFVAWDGTHERSYVSDGTAAGTRPLPGADDGCNDFTGSLALGATVVVYRCQDTGGQAQIWRTSPDQGNPLQLTFFPPGTPVAPPRALGSQAMFWTVESPDETKLWTTDGTVAGTQPGALVDGAIRRVDAVDDQALLVVSGAGDDIWFTDGTPAGTRRIADTEGYVNNPLEPVRVGETIYFFAPRNPYSNGLWRTDGTPEGTAPVFASATMPGSLVTGGRLTLPDALLYFALDGGNPQRIALWRLAPGASTPSFVAHLEPEMSTAGSGAPVFSSAELGADRYFFASDGVHGSELWRTDGTPGGTVLVADIRPGPSSSHGAHLATTTPGIVFAADDGVHGVEPWTTDGSSAGTRILVDLAPGPASSSPSELAVVGGRLYFSARDGLVGLEPWTWSPTTAPTCTPSATALCLRGGRFRVETRWRDFTGRSGVGQAVALTPDTGYFWFFAPSNVETIVKVLDGTRVNGHHWTFYGALSNVEYTTTVTDTATGATRRYVNPPRSFASVGDTRAFGPLATGGTSDAAPAAPAPIVSATRNGAAVGSTCTADPHRLCLAGNRFGVEVQWNVPSSGSGPGVAVPLSDDTGYFWFFGASNVELVLKVLDGTAINGRHWVFYGALSNVEYTITVTDTVTGQQRSYHNPRGRMASVGDTSAF